MDRKRERRHEPAISVIVPVFNGERYLAEALESIVGQTRPPEEIIVVDDGSTDRTAEVARRFPVRLLRQANAGAAAARNAGAEAANADLLAFLDHDDLWVADKLERQMAALAADPALDMVFGHVEQFFCPSLTAEQRAHYQLTPPMPAYTSPARLIRRASFAKVGPYAIGNRLGEVLEWHARAVDAGLRLAMLPGIVYRRRIHASNMGITRSQDRSDYAHVLKQILDRRRRDGACR